MSGRPAGRASMCVCVHEARACKQIDEPRRSSSRLERARTNGAASISRIRAPAGRLAAHSVGSSPDAIRIRRLCLLSALAFALSLSLSRSPSAWGSSLRLLGRSATRLFGPVGRARLPFHQRAQCNTRAHKAVQFSLIWGPDKAVRRRRARRFSSGASKWSAGATFARRERR